MSPEKQSTLDAVCVAVNKQWGKGTVMKFTETPPFDPESITPTGSIGLDSALGIGGWPRGRIIEIFGAESSGKTTLALQAIANRQKKGGHCLFIDAEHALDIRYAEALGVNVQELILSQPDFGEQALNIADSFIKSGEIDLIVIDSVAALIPKSELEGDIGDHSIGTQAKMMSQAMRKLTAIIHRTNTTVIFLNQIRHKIGVVFGCLHYDTLINFVDGRSLPIGEIVDKKIKGKVYSLNLDTKEVEAKTIIGWHDNGIVNTNKDFLHIQTESINGGGRFGFSCTLNHKVLTEKGWKKAKELSYEDKLISKYEETINKSYGDFINGCLVGDSHLSSNSKNSVSLKLQDNENIEYVNWKIDKLSSFLNFTERKIKNRGYRYETSLSYEWSKIKKELGNRDPMYMLNQYSNLGMAIWIMDDGTLDLKGSHKRYLLSIKRFKNQENKLQEIQSKLNSLGFLCTYNLEEGLIRFQTKITNLIASSISKYIPKCMEYKLPKEFHKQYKDFKLSNSKRLKTDTVQIKELRFASDRQMRNKRKFDISVKENHNYMVGGIKNGVVVHNSPETVSGGNALKFYSSVRARISRTGSSKEKQEISGNTTKVKVVKNKMAPPFKEAEFEIKFGEGIDNLSELIKLAEEDNLIQKTGAWFKYEGEAVGQGKDNTIVWLKENPEIKEKIRKEILENRGL